MVISRQKLIKVNEVKFLEGNRIIIIISLFDNYPSIDINNIAMDGSPEIFFVQSNIKIF